MVLHLLNYVYSYRFKVFKNLLKYAKINVFFIQNMAKKLIHSEMLIHRDSTGARYLISAKIPFNTLNEQAKREAQEHFNNSLPKISTQRHIVNENQRIERQRHNTRIQEIKLQKKQLSIEISGIKAH